MRARSTLFLSLAVAAAFPNLVSAQESDEYDWDALDAAEEVADEAAESADEYDWDALDAAEEVAEEAAESADEYDWDALDAAEEAAEEAAESAEEYDWDALDAAEQVADEAADSAEEYDWDALDSAGDDDTDWDAYWDEIDSEEEADAVEIPVEVAADLGGVQGVIIDAEIGEPVSGATVSISGTEIQMRTAANGVFFFELEPADYVLRVEHFELRGVSYQVTVEPGEITDIAEVRMVPSDNQMTVVVEGRAVQESTAQQLRERQESATVQDAVSAEQISQAGDSSAGGAVRRVVGVTLVEDRFLVVRGLGGRYNQVTLNGVPVPLTDPDFPSAEVDMFPTELLSGLTLTKNPAAGLPTFTGGLMDIETRAYPEEFELALSASFSGDTNTTFQSFRADPLGGTDALGFDNGARDWPDMPTEQTLDRRTTENYLDIARGMPNVWESTDGTARPNFGLKLNVGDTVSLGERNFGYLLMAGYSNALTHTSATRARVGREFGELAVREELDLERYQMKTTWGTLANLSLDLADGHTLRLISMWNHMGRERFDVASGLSDEESRFLERTQREWLQRSLVFNELLGSHRRLLPESSPWHETRVDWRASLSIANRVEPDTRYYKELDGQWDVNPGSGEHFRSDLDQSDVFGALDLQLPYLDVFSTTVGGSATRTARTFETRRVRYNTSNGTADLLALGPEEAFADGNIGADGTPIYLREYANAGDSYEVQQRTLAAYANAEVSPLSWLRVTAGVRYESATQDLADTPIVGEPDPDNQVFRTDNDVLGSAALIFELREGMFVRAVYGGSVARPQMREIAPFASQDYVRRRVQTGNPDLLRTYIHNADLRWEWFPSATEVVAASLFYKAFENPIEATLVNRQGDVAFLNADGSTNFGAELEAQLDLGRIGPRAAGLFLGGNVAIIESSIDLPCDDADANGECDQQYTNASRPMEGQAPWQVNARFGWDAPDNGFAFTLLYGVLGRTLTDVGTNGLPDTVVEPQHLLDLTMSYAITEQWKVSLKLRNLLLQTERESQGDIVTYEERTPMSFGLSVGWGL